MKCDPSCRVRKGGALWRTAASAGPKNSRSCTGSSPPRLDPALSLEEDRPSVHTVPRTRSLNWFTASSRLARTAPGPATAAVSSVYSGMSPVVRAGNAERLDELAICGTSGMDDVLGLVTSRSPPAGMMWPWSIPLHPGAHTRLRFLLKALRECGTGFAELKAPRAFRRTRHVPLRSASAAGLTLRHLRRIVPAGRSCSTIRLRVPGCSRRNCSTSATWLHRLPRPIGYSRTAVTNVTRPPPEEMQPHVIERHAAPASARTASASWFHASPPPPSTLRPHFCTTSERR